MRASWFAWSPGTTMNGASRTAWSTPPRRWRSWASDVMTSFRTLDDIGDVTGKRVLVRVDLNVPMQEGEGHRRHPLPRHPADRHRTGRQGRNRPAARPFRAAEGAESRTSRWRSSRRPYEQVLGRPVRYIDWEGRPGERRHASARRCRDPRKHPLLRRRGEERSGGRRSLRRGSAISMSTMPSPPRTAPMPRPRGWRISCRPMRAGRWRRSSNALDKALGNPERPVAAVVGGAKVSTKLEVLRHLVAKVDHLIIGGGMANTFLAARGVECRQVAVRARPDRHRRGDPRRRRPGELHRASAL